MPLCGPGYPTRLTAGFNSARGETEVAAMGAIFRAWSLLDPNSTGLRTAQVVDQIDRIYREDQPDLADALGNLVPGNAEDRRSRPGYKFRQFKRRNIGGYYLDQTAPAGGSNRWIVRPVTELRTDAANART
jgi:hypothetical protein